jgi:hypothetical protein
MLPFIHLDKLRVAIAAHALLTIATAADFPYQPCPLLRSYYPAPTLNRSSETAQSLVSSLIGLFDELISTGGSDDFDTITPNTTSFPVILFMDDDEDSVFFKYYHTADAAQKSGSMNVTADTVFPRGIFDPGLHSLCLAGRDGRWRHGAIRPGLGCHHDRCSGWADGWDQQRL